MNPFLLLGATDPVRCGCDRDATGDLMPVDEALARGLALARAVEGTERLPLGRATGRGLARAADLPGDGEEILPAGRVIGPREAAALAASGQGEVAVRRRLEVAILSIGGPSSSGEPPDPGRLALSAQLAAPWARLLDLGALPGNPARLRPALMQAAGRADLVVTLGGLSAGEGDLLPRLVREIGGAVDVSSVAMRPGGALGLGRIAATPWIGLPGDPVAGFVGWTVIGARIAEAMAGIAGGGPRKEVVRLARPAAHHPGRCEFRLARGLGYDAHGAQVVELLPGGASRRVASLAQADGLVLVPAEAEALAAGTVLEFLPF